MNVLYHRNCLIDFYNKRRKKAPKIVKEQFDETVKQEAQDANSLILQRAANIVRGSLFTSDFQNEAVPEDLFSLMKMILEGKNDETITEERKTIVNSICQIIMFNSLKRKRNNAVSNIRHDSYKETLIPIYNALKVHVNTRSKDIIEKQHELGLSISYKRTLQLASNIAHKASEKYHKEGVVCPAHLPKGAFTTSALDNLDHDPSSTMSNWSFHGTALSLTCHRESNTADAKVVIPVTASKETGLPLLPDSYAVVPFAKLGKSFNVPCLEDCSSDRNTTEEYEKVNLIFNFIQLYLK